MTLPSSGALPMKIYFTGASSFSGFWFCKALGEAGHEVTATFTRESVEAYPEAGFAKARVAMAQDFVRPVWGARMGNDAYFAALEHDHWDLVCLHGAYVADHKAADFPVLEALASNTAGIQRMVKYLAENGGTPILWTGTYFEANEGQGTQPLRNFSPYALSKQLSWEIARFYAEQAGLPISKFVMPNPFGPWESKGFTSYLAKTWLSGGVPTVNKPDYIRDNCPVTLLANAYCKLVESGCTENTVVQPSGYVSTQVEFGRKCADEIGKHWDKNLRVRVSDEPKHDEPMKRFNVDSAIKSYNSFREFDFWKSLSAWYKQKL